MELRRTIKISQRTLGSMLVHEHCMILFPLAWPPHLVLTWRRALIYLFSEFGDFPFFNCQICRTVGPFRTVTSVYRAKLPAMRAQCNACNHAARVESGSRVAVLKGRLGPAWTGLYRPASRHWTGGGCHGRQDGLGPRGRAAREGFSAVSQSEHHIQ